MNTSQRTIVVIATLVLGIMILFPPWLFVYNFPGEDTTYKWTGKKTPPYYATRFAGYHPIWGANRPEDQLYLSSVFGLSDHDDLRYFSMRIDKDRLWLQFGGVVVITILLAFTLKDNTKRH